MLTLTRQLIVPHEATLLRAPLRGLRLKNGSDQPITVSRINLLHVADPADFLRIIALVEFTLENTLGATQLRRARGLHIVGVSEIRIH